MRKPTTILRPALLLCLAWLCAATAGCSMYYRIFTPARADYYAPAEKSLHDNLLNAIEFDYGYDMDVRLDYVHPSYEGFERFRPDEKNFQKAVKGADLPTLISYYEKLYRLRHLYDVRLEKYEKAGQWKYHTYLEKYLVPPLVHYADLVEKEVLRRDKDYREAIESRKEELNNEMLEEEYRREFEALWENDYNS